MPTEASEPRTRWQVRVDTGGTFTDCVAVGPGDRNVRAKALSSSALRGRIIRIEEGSELIVDGLENLPSDPLRDWRIRIPGQERVPEMAVEGWERGHRRLTLGRNLPKELRETELIELRCPGEAPILATHLALGVPWGAELPVLDLRLATTLGTNALLERRGAATVLFVTRGFGDLLRIGDQSRPELFALEIRRPEPYCRDVIEVDERLDARGNALRGVPLDGLRREVDEVLERGVRSAAVSLLHAYRNGDHERRLASFLRREGFEHVSVSHEVSPLLGYLQRTRTAVVDAYLAPIFRGYLERIRGSLTDGSRILVMTSSGGLL
ncbi:MAG: hydantoinase/oxoprolinase N-terminal domain-containing protein, partial [Thermoanaerobaculia bacterium]|nr:hydantoinase/oxoprolinase N-terminal domain-containing protein [Thermoanaerobaculia bacterium]